MSFLDFCKIPPDNSSNVTFTGTNYVQKPQSPRDIFLFSKQNPIPSIKINNIFSTKKPKNTTNSVVNNLVKKYNNALKYVGNKQAFVQRVVQIAQKYNADPNAMIVMFYSEGELNPKSSGGICGMMPYIIKKYGISIEKFRSLPAIKQLDYYERLLDAQINQVFGKNKPSKLSAGIMYAMNFTPGYVKDAMKDPKHILVSAKSSDPQKRKIFFANDGEGSIADGKNYISFETIEARLRRKEQEAVKLG